MSYQATASVWVRAEAEGVVLVGRRKDRLEHTASGLGKLKKGLTKVLTIAADMTVETNMEHVFAEIKNNFGRPADVVVANAATVSKIQKLVDQDASEWWRVIVRRRNYDEMVPL